MRNRPRKSIRLEGLFLDPTSSLNQFFLCECGVKYTEKDILIKHLAKCSGKAPNFVCRWCNLTFKNRGNLVQHSKFLHGDNISNTSSNEKLKKHQCAACDAKYEAEWKLKFHIRKNHFNLWAASPHCETKQVNQVWFEKVLNSPNIVEIKKTGPNTLLMKGVSPDVAVKLTDQATDKIDLHNVYPTGRKQGDTLCKICNKVFRNRVLKKHIMEAHQADFSKHTCNNCGCTFKRSYIFLKHVCNKKDMRRGKRKVEGVTQYGKRGITITNVSSLHPVEIED